MGNLVRGTAMVALVAGFSAGLAGFAHAQPSALAQCPTAFNSCKAGCGKTRACIAKCGGPFEKCVNAALATKPPAGLKKKPARKG